MLLCLHNRNSQTKLLKTDEADEADELHQRHLLHETLFRFRDTATDSHFWNFFFNTSKKKRNFSKHSERLVLEERSLSFRFRVP